MICYNALGRREPLVDRLIRYSRLFGWIFGLETWLKQLESSIQPTKSQLLAEGSFQQPRLVSWEK